MTNLVTPFKFYGPQSFIYPSPESRIRKRREGNRFEDPGGQTSTPADWRLDKKDDENASLNRGIKLGTPCTVWLTHTGGLPVLSPVWKSEFEFNGYLVFFPVFKLFFYYLKGKDSLFIKIFIYFLTFGFSSHITPVSSQIAYSTYKDNKSGCRPLESDTLTCYPCQIHINKDILV